MASSEDYYIAKVEAMGHEDLINLWKARNDDADVKLFWKSGKVLEYTLLRAFELEGATIRWPYNVNIGDDENGSVIEQIDGSIQFEHFYVLVECKDQQHAVNIEPFAKMRNQLMRRPSAVIGCIFSTSGFTEPALVLSQFSAPQTILLWNGDEFEYCLENGCFIDGFKKKFGKAIEEFVFNYNIVPDKQVAALSND